METKFKVGMECVFARKAAVVIDVDERLGAYPIVAKVEDGPIWKIETFAADGRNLFCGTVYLTPAPRKVKVSGWVNVYVKGERKYLGSLHTLKEDAERMNDGDAFGRKYIEFEVEEGEGLDRRDA